LTKTISGLLLLILIQGTTVLAQSKRLNILWLSVEDMSPHLGSYGERLVATPHLDKLASRAIRYTNAFTAAGVCAPSRNAIITGRMQTSNGGHNMRTLNNTYPEQTGLPKSYSAVMPEDVRPLPEYLRAAGYWCTNNAKTDYQFEDGPTYWDQNGNKAHYRNRPEGMPFFSVFNCNITHESQVWERRNRPLRVDPAKVTVPPIWPDTDSVRLDIARFLTNVSEMDDWVGERLQELEASGEMDNTIIMFWADHGDGLPWFKREITDRGIRVPLLISLPDRKASVDDRLISSIDWAPTVLSLAGIRPPESMQGQPFLGKYAQKQARQYVFAARDRLDSHYDRVRSVHDGRFQYLRNYYPELPYYMDLTYRRQQASMRDILRWRDAGRLDSVQMPWFLPKGRMEELYDVKADPWQLKNLADDPAYAAVLKRLQAVYENWQREVPDLGDIDEKSLISRWWNGAAVPPVTSDPLMKRKGKQLHVSCETPGASIGYRIANPGSAAAIRWEVYTSPITISDGQRVEVIAHRIGYKTSNVVVHQ
jgi:arylsulfatase A-like enzyme